MTNYIRDPSYDVSGVYDLAEGFFVDLQFMVIPKGQPGDPAVSHAFINFALEPHVQAAMAEQVWYGPINRKTQLSASALKSPYIPTPKVIEQRAVKVDVDHLAHVRADWTKRYTEILAG